MKALECSQLFSHCKSLVIFFRRSRTANSAVYGPIRLNFKLIPDFIVVLFTGKNEKDSIKNEGRGAHRPSGKSVGLRIGRPGFDPRPGRCVVSLSKRHLLPKSTGNTQE